MDHNEPTPPAEKEYCVWAESRVFQTVRAGSPSEAARIAAEHPENFENCDEGSDNYELDHYVLDVESGEEVPTDPAAYCTTCRSEIVEAINDSHFGDGECGGCEYRRYKTQPALLEASHHAYAVLCDLSYHWCFRGKSKTFRLANFVIDRLASALNAYGDAS